MPRRHCCISDRIWDMYLVRTVTFSLFSLRNTAISHCQNSILQVSPIIFRRHQVYQCFDIDRTSAHLGERQCQFARMLCTCADYHTRGICVLLLTACPLGRSCILLSPGWANAEVPLQDLAQDQCDGFSPVSLVAHRISPTATSITSMAAAFVTPKHCQ